MKAELSKLGLTENEITVYLKLLELGPSLAGSISRKTGIHRRTVYDITERLIEKGLVGYILNNNRRYFEASNPEQFKELVKEQESVVDSILPELMQQYNIKQDKKSTSFYRGKRGLKAVFDDQLAQKNDLFIIGGSAEAYDVLKFYFPHYDRERKKKKINAKIIFNYEAKKLKLKLPLATIKYLPKEMSTPSATNIYGDTVSIILWGEDPFAIVIRDKAIAQSYKNYFTLLWKSSIR